MYIPTDSYKNNSLKHSEAILFHCLIYAQLWFVYSYFQKLKKLNKDDILIVAELSRLGRSMLEVMNLIIELSEKGVKFIFLRQPELGNFNNPSSKLLLSIYGYMAETERDFISQRTKAGLEKAKKSGKKLGRPKGSIGRSMYDNQLDSIREHLKILNPIAVWRLTGINGSYNAFYNFCRRKNILNKDIGEKK